MIKLKPIALAVVGCGLLQGCGAPPSQTIAMQPVVRGDMPGNQAASWNRLARFHHERGQLALALGAYAQSLALDANQLEARNAVAVIEAQQGNLEAARGALTALVNDYPGEAQPHTNLGYVLHLMGEHAGAAQTLRRAMALGAGPKAFQNLRLAEAALQGAPGAEAQHIAAASAAQPAPGHAPIHAPTAGSAKPPAPAPAAGGAALAPASADSAAAAGPAVARSAPQQLAVLNQPAQAIGSRMELVQVAANVFELKTRVAAEPPPAPAMAQAPARPALQAVAQAEKVRMARLEIANGNGVTGMARRFRSLLGQMGIPVERLSNDKPYKQVATTIQYSPGFEKQAASLQKALQGKAQLSSRQLAASDVRLVLGKDAPLSLAAAHEAAGLSLAAVHGEAD